MLTTQTEVLNDNADNLTFLQRVFYNLKQEAEYAASVMLNPKIYTYEGIRLPLGAAPELQRFRRHIYRKLYERQELEAIRQLLRPDDIVLEIGGGCGIISTFIAQRLSDSNNLHTFEANSRLLKTIECVASTNDVKVNVTNAAVGLKEEKREFFFYEDDLLGSSAFRSDSARRQKVKTEMVQCVAISDVLARIRPTFIVFDIEGAEQEVLTVPIPQEVRVLCGELHPRIIGDHAVSDVIRSIMNSGFDLLLGRSEGQAVAFARPE